MDDVSSGGPRDVVANNVSSVIDKRINNELYLNTDKSKLITNTATLFNLPSINRFVHSTVNDASLLDSPLVIGTALNVILNKSLLN